MRARPERRESERGEAYIVLLVLVLLATVFSATLIAASSVGMTAEARRYGQQRAQMNALSGLVLAEVALKRDLPSVFKQLAIDANNSAGAIDQDLPYLAGATFDPVEMHFDMPGSDATDEDTADVHVEISLSRPPDTVGLAGVASSSNVQRQERYVFIVDLRSTGHAIYDAKAVARRESQAFVGLVLGGGMDSGVRSTLGSGNVIEVGRADLPLGVDREPTDWNLLPVAYADGGGITFGSSHLGGLSGYTLSGGGAPTGGWSGEPILLSYGSPMKAGLANGNAVYYWYAMGLPPGSAGDPSAGPASVQGARGIVLATDDWRFDPSYRASDDTIAIQRADGSVARGKGSPLYGVIAIQAPAPFDAARAIPLPDLAAWFRIPGVGVRQYVVTDPLWQPNVAQPVSDAVHYTTLGYPANPIDRSTSIEARVVRPDPPLGATIAVVSETSVEGATTSIAVPGNPPSQGQLTGTSGLPSNAPGLVTVAIVQGRRAQIGMEWRGTLTGSAGATTNSQHGIIQGAPISINGGGGVIVDPPPPGGGSTTQLIAFLYWPGSTWWLPEAVDSRPGK